MKSHATFRCLRSQGVLLLAALPLAFAGCGGGQPTAVFDATVLLERYEQDRRRHDPHAYSEVDLGEFTVTWRPKPNELNEDTSTAAPLPTPVSLIIRFHLYGVVADSHLEEFSRLLETHGERMRSQVREAVQSSRRSQLDDPMLGWLKSELIQSINRSLQAPILRDAVFGEFALERG